MSRPSQPRNERGRRQQFDQNDYMDQLRAQAEEQKRRKEQELVTDQKQTLAHYQNYAIGGDGEQDYVRDLNNLIRNKEHLLEEKSRQLGQEQPMVGDFKGFNPSQGIAVPGSEVPEHFKPQRPLWDGLPTGLNDENKNTNNSVFGSGAPSLQLGGGASGAEAERERRLQLRDQERQRRFAGQSESQFTPASQPVPAYGTGGSEPPPPKGMPGSSSSRRDQIWEQKRLAKLGGHMIASPSGEQGVQLPVRSMRPPSHEEMRRSMKQEKFNEARNLDQSLNQEQWLAQNQGSKAARLQSARMVDQEVAKSQVFQQELGQMPALGGLPLGGPVSRQIPQQPQQQPPQSYGAGIIPVDKAESSKEEKLRKQREYREMLDQQKFTADTRVPPSAQSQRAAAADQVFQEILTQEKMRQSNQKFYQPPSQGQPPVQGLPPASAQSSSVPSSHHQQQKLILQQKQEQNNFVLANQASDEKKQKKAQMQREYAESLQQQMAEKKNHQQQQFEKRRGTQSHQARPMEEFMQQPQQPQQIGAGIPQQFNPSNPMPNQFTPSNPLPSQFTPQIPQSQFTPQVMQPSYQMGEPQMPISQPEAFQPSVGALRQMQPEVPSYTPSLPQYGQDIPQAHERNNSKVQEYRQALEQQMKEVKERQNAQDPKQQAIERLQNAMEQPVAVVPQQQQQQQQQPVQQNFVRQRTDICRTEDQKQTEEQHMKKMRLQQELQLQIDEKQRKKEEEKAKIRAEEAREEEKLKKEREMLLKKDIQEMEKDSKNPNADGGVKQAKQNHRNAQFQPSQENPMNHNKVEAPVQVSQQVPVQQPVQLPIDQQQQQQEPAFKPRQAYHQEPSGFQGFGSESGFSAPNPVQVPQQIEPQVQAPVLENQFSQPNPQLQNFGQGQPQQNYASQPQLNQNFIPEQRAAFSQPSETQNIQGSQQEALVKAYEKAIADLIQTKIQIQEENIKMKEKILLDKENAFRMEQQKVESQEEVRNLQKVQNYLHQVIGATQKNGAEQVEITPKIQEGLEELIQRGKSGIQDLERSQVFMQGLYQKQKQQQELPQNPMNQTPYANQVQYQYQQQQVQQQVNQQVQEQARAHDSKPDPLEQSLSSQTKLCILTNNLAKNQEQQFQTQEDLMQTWKPEQQQVQNLNQTEQSNQHHLLQASLAGTSKLVTGFQQTPAKPLEMQDQSSRPTTNLKVDPIREQPENEDAGDFLREDSRDQQEQNTLGTGINPLGNTTTIENGMRQIERMNNGTATQFYHTNNGGFQHQQAAKATGSDFFNATASKMHQETSNHVFNEQLNRIMGKTGQNNMNVVAEESKDMGQQDESSIQQDQQLSNPIDLARNNEMAIRQQQQIQQNNQFYQGTSNLDTLNEEQKQLLMTNEINIAASLTKTQAQGMPIVPEEATQQSPEQQKPVQRQTWNSRKTTPQQQNMNISEHQQQYGFQEDKPVTSYQPEEVKFVDNLRMQTAQVQNHEESDEGDVWNDPDVVPVVNDQDEEDEIEGTQQYPATEQMMNQGNIGESHIDGSIDKLKAFSPPSEEKFFIGQADDEQEDGEQKIELDVGSKLGDYSKINYSQTQEEDLYQKLAPLTDEQKLQMAEERQQNPHKFSTFGIPAAEAEEVADEAPEESKTATKKQQEMMEIAQLIAKATEKTNHLFDQQQKAQASGQNFRPASRKERPNPAETEFVEEDPVLKGLDNLIGNLESQRVQQDPEEQARQSRFDATGASHRSGLPPKSARKQRPQSGKSNKSVEGKYSAIAREASRHSSRGTPLGKFAQMGSSKIKEDDFQQVSQKFNASPMLNKKLEDPLDKDGQQRKSILRPVSGKSHSQRYQQSEEQQQ